MLYVVRCLIVIRFYMLFSNYSTFLIFLLCLFSCFYTCVLFCVFCAFVLYYILFLLLFIAVSFPFLYKFTDHCHLVETQLQQINIVSYHIISNSESCDIFCCLVSVKPGLSHWWVNIGPSTFGNRVPRGMFRCKREKVWGVWNLLIKSVIVSRNYSSSNIFGRLNQEWDGQGMLNVWHGREMHESVLSKDREGMKELWRYKYRRDNNSEMDWRDTEEYGLDSFC